MQRQAGKGFSSQPLSVCIRLVERVSKWKTEAGREIEKIERRGSVLTVTLTQAEENERQR